MTKNPEPRIGTALDLRHRRGFGEGGPDRAGPGALRRPLRRPVLHGALNCLLPGQVLGRGGFAMRFAAKEAFSKALGVGLRENGIRWREVEVIPNPLGKPDFL